jgi:arylsulfatase A-like enzyme
MKSDSSKVTRREFVAGMGALGAMALTGDRRPTQRPTQRPNILFIIVDQWSAAAANLAGSKGVLRTPAFDSFVASGVSFNSSYCSYPLCSPSRASLFTGRMPHETGVIFNIDDERDAVPHDMPALGSLFADAGYDTGYFGKEHSGGVAYRGFQARGSIQFTGAGYLASGSVLDSVFTRDAINFIQTRRSAPFLAVASLINPHDIGYTMPTDPIPGKSMVDISGAFGSHEKYLRGQDFPLLPANFNPEAEPLMCHPFLRRLLSIQRGWTEQQWRLYLATYCLLVENTDWLVGRLLRALRDSGQEDNTLVVFTSDHGDQMTAHHLVGKGVFYEEATRVPFVLSWRGVIKPDQINNHALVSGIDVLPTFCDYAGVRMPIGLPGRSVRPLIGHPGAQWREYVVSEIFDGRMLRTQTHKYVLHQRDGAAEFLFDLRNDPGETRNLVGDPASKSTLKQSRALLNDWMKETGGTFERTRPSEEIRRLLEGASAAAPPNQAKPKQ